MKDTPLPLPLAKALKRALCVLRIEQCWRFLRWAVLSAVLWGAAAYLHIPQHLPDSLHALLECGLLGGIFVWVFYRVKHTPPPSINQADRRIERDSHLSFRPIAALTDQLALANTLSPQQQSQQTQLWAVHHARLTAALTQLRVHRPHFFPHWPARLIGLAILCSFIGFSYIIGGTAGARLKAGFIPGFDDDSVPLPTLQIWIDRPSYAAGAPIFLNDHTSPAPLPEGSHLHIIVSGTPSRPHLSGATEAHYKHHLGNSWDVEAVLRQTGIVRLSARGRRIGRWDIHINADTPPSVKWTHKAGAVKDSWHTAFPWAVSQPYGVATLEVHLRPIVPPHKDPLATSDTIIALPLEKHPQKAEDTTELDISDSPFAGLYVEGRLCATSLSQKEACSSPQRFRLGQRTFHDPLSRALRDVRLRLATGEDSLSDAGHTLGLLAALPLSMDVKLPLTVLQQNVVHGLSADALSQQLWFLALYSEDKAQSGTSLATSMLAIRSLEATIRQQLVDMAQHTPPSSHEQTTLHETLEQLKEALNAHMTLVFQKASQSGLVMPMPGGKGMPWVHLATVTQSDGMAGRTLQAQAHLHAMVEMAEQMRQATMPDMQALAASMRAQEEARAQRMALRNLIQDETSLLNHAQKRLANETPSSHLDNTHKDISEMSTEDLLRQLGMAPTGGSAPSAPVTLDQNAILRHADERQHDHATQYALRTLTKILNQRGETLTHKKMPNLLKAEKDMAPALHSLATRQDETAVKDIQTVLNDLAQARQDMRKNQSEANHNQKSHLGFIPPPSASSSEEQNGVSGLSSDDDPNGGQDDDNETHEDETQPKNQDPLGRKMDDSPDSDAHIPEHDHNRAHDIERELQKRASDRTRPQSELDYLNHLLAPLRQPH